MKKNIAKEIFFAAVRAVQPDKFIPSLLRRNGNRILIDSIEYNMEGGRLFIIAVGKAAAAMAKNAEEICGEMVAGGIVVTKTGHGMPLKFLSCYEAGHPVPDENGVVAAKKIEALANELKEEDLVLCLISGGASALVADIPEEIGLEDYKSLSTVLLNCGATIQEINIIRKKLSFLKGGKLAELCQPARVVSLILSDIVGDPIESIASGLTVKDPSSVEEALELIEKYKLKDKIPASVINFLEKHLSASGTDNFFIYSSVRNILAATNKLALEAAAKKAIELGYEAKIITDTLEGEASEVAVEIIKHAIEYTGKKPVCLLYGGETTVTIKGKGKGGRNQELALAALIELKKQGEKNITILSAGTDGTDGPTDAAGATGDISLIENAEQSGIVPADYLYNNDAYTFFSNAGGLIITGPTNTNVMDVVVVLIYPG